MKASQTLLAVTLGVHLLAAQQTAPNPDAPAIFAHARAATVIILAGEGAGRLHAIATGVLISPDGVLLTALHAIKNAAEVRSVWKQVRLSIMFSCLDLTKGGM
jgi:S1-C subfamily serine protease